MFLCVCVGHILSLGLLDHGFMARGLIDGVFVLLIWVFAVVGWLFVNWWLL